MNIYPEIKFAVTDWDVIVIGHLRWNRYFGEGPQMPSRGDPSTCTSTIVRGKDFNGKDYVLLIDPTMRWTPEAFYFDVNRRTGLKPENITHCYCTHHHLDHYDGFKYFPNAIWYTAEPVAEILWKEARTIDGSKIAGIKGEFLPGVYALPLPGHTPTLHGIAFSYNGKKVVVAGDAVMTRHHFVNNTTEYQPDPAYNEIAAQTIFDLKSSFDIVVPGHDNVIVR